MDKQVKSQHWRSQNTNYSVYYMEEEKKNYKKQMKRGVKNTLVLSMD